jgi:hypothetical protein
MRVSLIWRQKGKFISMIREGRHMAKWVKFQLSKDVTRYINLDEAQGIEVVKGGITVFLGNTSWEVRAKENPETHTKILEYLGANLILGAKK